MNHFSEYYWCKYFGVVVQNRSRNASGRWSATGQNIEQGRLAATAVTHERNDFSGLHGARDVRQNVFLLNIDRGQSVACGDFRSTPRPIFNTVPNIMPLKPSVER